MTTEPQHATDGTFLLTNGKPYLTNRQPLRPLEDLRYEHAAETVRVLARRAGSRKPTLGLSSLAALRYHLERLEYFSVANARHMGGRGGISLRCLGVSRQLLHKRYAREFPGPRRQRRVNPSPYTPRRTRG